MSSFSTKGKIIFGKFCTYLFFSFEVYKYQRLAEVISSKMLFLIVTYTAKLIDLVLPHIALFEFKSWVMSSNLFSKLVNHSWPSLYPTHQLEFRVVKSGPVRSKEVPILPWTTDTTTPWRVRAYVLAFLFLCVEVDCARAGRACWTVMVHVAQHDSQ